jgi:CysZ protein
LNPVSDFAVGFKAFLRGVRWLLDHKRYLLLLTLPMLLGLLFLTLGLSFFMDYDESILSFILFDRPESWILLPFYWLAFGFLWLGSFVLVLVAALLFMNIIASPIYEIVSVAVERDLLGKEQVPSLSFTENLKIILVECKKVMFILALSLVLLFIPMVNIVSTLITGFLVGWDFFDYPLARRDFSFQGRLKIVGQDFFKVLGFGIWLVIPFLQIVVLPLSVAGGTILSVEALRERNLLSGFSKGG